MTDDNIDLQDIADAIERIKASGERHFTASDVERASQNLSGKSPREIEKVLRRNQDDLGITSDGFGSDGSLWTFGTTPRVRRNFIGQRR